MAIINLIREYFTFEKKEIQGIIFTSLIFGFCLAFSNFSIFNLLVSIIIAISSIFIHISVQKIVSIKIGHTAEFQPFWYGTLFCLIITFITNGKLWWIIVPGGITTSIIAKQRIGKFRFGLNPVDMAIIGLSGPVANIIFGSIFQNITLYTPLNSVWITNIFLFNLAYAIFSLFPIPPLDGISILFASRLIYVLVFASLLVYGFLVLLFGIYSWIWAIMVGLLIWLFYYIFLEQKF